jgi:hypothetical protein
MHTGEFMATDSIPNVDLAELAGHLSQTFEGVSLEGSIVGRTKLRDAVTRYLGCSSLQSDILVDMMVGRGILVFDEQVVPNTWRVVQSGTT